MFVGITLSKISNLGTTTQTTIRLSRIRSHLVSGMNSFFFYLDTKLISSTLLRTARVAAETAGKVHVPPKHPRQLI